MDLSASLDDSGTITVTAVNIHPVERAAVGVLIAELVARLHSGLMHCDGDG